MPGSFARSAADVAMRVPREACAGGEARVEQRGVIEPVLEHVVAATDQHATPTARFAM